MPASLAASTFSFNPPIGSTSPRRVISPVIAKRRLIGLPVSTERIAAPMVMPADGPSLGIEPAGTWMWRSCLAKKSSPTPWVAAKEAAKGGAARAGPFTPRAGGAGEQQPPRAGAAPPLDEQRVAPRRRPGEAGG